MNSWLNKRLNIIDKSINLAPCYPLVLVHGDLCWRNIIVMDDNTPNSNSNFNSKDETTFAEKELCLVDWDHAALLPRVFETTAMLCYHNNWAYSQGLLQATKKEIGRLREAEE
jgi:thiamine kinase-like enzyme